MSTSICFVLHHEVRAYKEVKDEFAEHKKALVRSQSHFMSKLDPGTQLIYLEEAKLFEDMRFCLVYMA